MFTVRVWDQSQGVRAQDLRKLPPKAQTATQQLTATAVGPKRKPLTPTSLEREQYDP